MITELKVDNPLFDFNLNFKDIFPGKQSLIKNQQIIQNYKPDFAFDRFIIDQSLKIQETNINDIEIEFINYDNTENIQYSEYIQTFTSYLKKNIESLDQLKKNDDQNQIQVLSKDRVALGGTFDYIHNGHKLLLSAALLIGKTIVIGLTGDQMLVNKKNKEVIQCNYKRLQELNKFIEFYALPSQFKIDIEIIQDPVGPAGVGHLDALVLSQETLKGGDYVNKVRNEKGLNKAEIIPIELISGSSQNMNQDSQKTSSSSIRDYILKRFQGDINYLKSCWDNYLGKGDLSQYWFQNVILYYSESQRYYHTLNHIHSMFKLFDQIKSQLKDPMVVAVTIWFHDIIYNPRRPDNEQRSADLFNSFISKTCTSITHITGDQQKLIYDYIIATSNHTKINSTDNDLNLFLDIDLSILGVGDTEYDQYSSDILLEYQHYEKKVLYKERAKVLQRFIDEETLFKTQFFKDKYQEKAKQNLKREVSKLNDMYEKLQQ